LLPADVLPDAPAGAALAAAGVDPATANSLFRSAAVVLYQGGAVVGAALLWWQSPSRHRPRPPPGRPDRPGRRDRPVLAALSIASLLLLAGAVAAPQLSDDYGPLRLFQQALTVLAIAVVLAVATVLRRLSPVMADRVAVGVAVGCLLTTSGVVPQLTGGYPPQLNLNNAGNYYRAYYTEKSDLSTSRWLDSHLSRTAVIVADGRDSTNLRGLTGLWPLTGLVPGAVPAYASVLVTTTDGRSATATAVVGDRVLRYEFPLACVAAGRPLLHIDGVHRLYGAAVRPDQPSTGKR
jgi:hypothetical protein